MSEAELERWLPVPFDEIADPLAAPEPSKGALVQLQAGMYVVVYFGRDSGQLIVEIPETTPDSAAVVEAFFNEVPLPPSRVLWHRPDIILPQSDTRSAASAQERDSGGATEDAPRVKRSAQRFSLPRRRK